MKTHRRNPGHAATQWQVSVDELTQEELADPVQLAAALAFAYPSRADAMQAGTHLWSMLEHAASMPPAPYRFMEVKSTTLLHGRSPAAWISQARWPKHMHEDVLPRLRGRDPRWLSEEAQLRHGLWTAVVRLPDVKRELVLVLPRPSAAAPAPAPTSSVPTTVIVGSGVELAAHYMVGGRCHGCGCGCDSVPRLLACGRCRAARYCGAECQRADWPKHKVVCPQLGVARAMQALRTQHEEGSGEEGRVQGAEYAKEFALKFSRFLRKAGAGPDWRQLLQHLKYNGRAIKDPKEDMQVERGGHWVLGHHIKRDSNTDAISWVTWTVQDGRVQKNFTATLSADGKRITSLKINCFGLGWMQGPDYGYLVTKLDRMLEDMGEWECE